MKVKDCSIMYQTKKRSEYKTGDKELPKNILGVDEKDDTHKYSTTDEIDSQKEDMSDDRYGNSPLNVSNNVKPIENYFINYKMRDEEL